MYVIEQTCVCASIIWVIANIKILFYFDLGKNLCVKLNFNPNYKATMNYTLNGLTCQRWDSPWWCHLIETSSALMAICAGNSPVPGEFPHKGKWHGSLMFSLIRARINGWVNTGEAGDLRRNRAHYYGIVMQNPHRHHYTNPGLFPEATIEEVANHCRTPDGSSWPWCFTTSPEFRSQCATLIWGYVVVE